jgi:hypothetical protein
VNFRTRLGTALIAAAVACPALPSAAGAKPIGEIFQVGGYVPARIMDQIGDTPIGGMQQLPPKTYRANGLTFRGVWVNAMFGRRTTTEALEEVRARSGAPVLFAVYADRKLTSRERRSFDVLTDFARDADVLMVKEGHPACNGLTLAQVRGIASGRITQWSEVGAALSGAADRIALRHQVVDRVLYSRFGVTKKPRAATGARDGGAAEAARNASVAAIGGWSRSRFAGGVCKVPIDGVAPSDSTVRDLSFKGAFPITLVAPKKRPRNKLNRYLLTTYARWLSSPQAAKMFRASGLIMKSDKGEGGAGGGTGGGVRGPSHDAQGRPITTRQDDAGALAALRGERLSRTGLEPGYFRLAFEPNSVVNILESGDGSSCTMSSGRWTLLIGWHYPEYGGGYMAQVRFDFDQPSEATIDLPDDPAAPATYGGDEWVRNRSLPGSC